MSDPENVQMIDEQSLTAKKSGTGKAIETPDSSNTTKTETKDIKKAEIDDTARVIVRKWTAVCDWSYNIEQDSCAICHNQLMIPCITCEAEPHRAEECSIAWGQCHHAYHFHCISKWLRNRSTCPLDDEEWDFVQCTANPKGGRDHAHSSSRRLGVERSRPPLLETKPRSCFELICAVCFGFGFSLMISCAFISALTVLL